MYTYLVIEISIGDFLFIATKHIDGESYQGIPFHVTPEKLLSMINRFHPAKVDFISNIKFN